MYNRDITILKNMLKYYTAIEDIPVIKEFIQKELTK